MTSELISILNSINETKNMISDLSKKIENIDLDVKSLKESLKNMQNKKTVVKRIDQTIDNENLPTEDFYNKYDIKVVGLGVQKISE